MVEVQFHKQQKISVVNTPTVCIILHINTIVSPWCNRVICSQCFVYSMSTKKVLVLPSAQYCMSMYPFSIWQPLQFMLQEQKTLLFQKRLVTRHPCCFIGIFQQLRMWTVFFIYLFIENGSTVESYISEQSVGNKSDQVIFKVTSGTIFFLILSTDEFQNTF